MTTIVKKRLQAVVALLVCFMVLFAAFPSVPFSVEVGALSAGDVIYFDTSCNEYGNLYSYGWRKSGPVYVRYTTSNIGSGSHDSVSWSNWTQLTTEATGYDPADSAAKLYEYALPVNDIKAVMFARTTQNWQDGDVTWPMEVSASNNYYYTALKANQVYGLTGAVENKAGTSYQRVKVEKKGGISDFAPQLPSDTTKRAYLAGVNYFNYFYDEQVITNEFGGESSQADQVIAQGQAKAPYIYFNRAVMANSSYMNATDEPMYLGEFWIGGGAENVGGNYNGQDYDSATAANVSAGQYPRNCGVTNIGNQSVRSQTVPNTTLQKFTWGANLAFRGNEKQSNFHVVATGLVDDTLSLDPTDPNYLTPTKNGARIPYFDKNWVNNTTITNLNTGAVGTGGSNHIGKVYTSTFPFYYDETVSLTASSNLKDKWQDSYVYTSGNNYGVSLTSSSDITLNCYKFDSLKNTVHVNKAGGMSESTGGDDINYSVWLATPLKDLSSNTVAVIQAYQSERPDIWSGLNMNTTTLQQLINAIISNHSTGFSDNEIDILDAGGMFSEPGHVKDVDGQNGFFPFNEAGDKTKELEYGFGVRLDIKFNIVQNGTEDGTSNGVPQIFRFTGDDDVWVFIDGKLALDMGGGHKNAIGEINFKTDQTAVLFTGSSSDTTIKENWDENNDGTIRSDVTKVNTATGSSEIGSILSSIKAEANAGAGGTATVGSNTVNISNEHTLTFFYMERGKLNSNMSLMFNFIAPEIIEKNEGDPFPSNPQEVNADLNSRQTDSTLKIREITNFDNVNPGLVDLTKKVAEDDVFKYTLFSDAQRNASMGTSSVWSPSRDTYTRTAEADSSITTTISTGLNTTPTSSGDIMYVKLLGSGDPYYMPASSITSVGIYMTQNSDKYLAVGRKLSNTLYIFEIPNGFSGASFKICYTRNSSTVLTEGVVTGEPSLDTGTDRDRWSQNQTNLSVGKAYSIGRWYGSNEPKNFGVEKVEDAFTTVTDNDQKYAAKNYNTGNGNTMANVANTNYIWKEAFTTKTGGSADTQLVNTTTSNGVFNLLYGTGADESSVTFKNQFYTTASTKYNVALFQQMVERQTSGTVNAWNTVERSMSKYYNTKASVVLNNYQASVNELKHTETYNITWSSSIVAPITDGFYIGNETGGMGLRSAVPAATTPTPDTAKIKVQTDDMEIIVSNYVNVGSVEITKALKYENGNDVEGNSDEFKFNVTISNVFGGSSNNVSTYTTVTYRKYADLTNNPTVYTTETMTVGTNCGVVSLKAGQKAIIDGIPEGTTVTVTEDHTSNQQATPTEWNDYYNQESGNTSHQPMVTAGYGDYNSSTPWMIDGSTSMSGVNVSRRCNGAYVTVTGSNMNPEIYVWGLSFRNTRPNPTSPTHDITLKVQKVWDGADAAKLTELGISSVKFILEQGTNSADLNGETGWSAYDYDSNSTNGDGGIVTLSGSDSVQNSSLTWEKIFTVVDQDGSGNSYYYRIREYGKDDAVFIYKDGGYYSQNFQAVYGAGTQASPVTNIGSANVGDTPGTSPATSDSYKTVVVGGTDTSYTYTLTLTIKNKYSDVTVGEGQPLPKTGARGVYAIVTFGAFAITIAGVALLIYRKKLQTVNIYAVKGSEKPKE